MKETVQHFHQIVRASFVINDKHFVIADSRLLIISVNTIGLINLIIVLILYSYGILLFSRERQFRMNDNESVTRYIVRLAFSLSSNIILCYRKSKQRKRHRNTRY